MNRIRIRQVAHDIQKAEHFDMSRYWRTSPSATGCGTPACIAGHACARYAKHDGMLMRLQAIDSFEELNAETFAVAKQILGLTDDQANELFEPNHILYMITPKMAVATLNRFANTGEIEWRGIDR